MATTAAALPADINTIYVKGMQGHVPSQRPKLECEEHDGIQDMVDAINRGKMLDWH